MGKNTGSNVMSADSTLSLQPNAVISLPILPLRLQQVTGNTESAGDDADPGADRLPGEKRRPGRHTTATGAAA